MLYRTLYLHNGTPATLDASNEEVTQAETNFSMEIQGFSECYKENCMAYDTQNKTCRMLENNRK